MSELILAAISLTVMLVSLVLLWQSMWKKEQIISEVAWDRLARKPRLFRGMFALGFVSLVIYLFAESAELFTHNSPSPVLGEIHEIGEILHMLIAAFALFSAVLIYVNMTGGEDAS